MTKEKEFEFAREMQSKMDYYFIGLIFTLLGLSIQSSKFTSFYWQNVCEITAWISLSISGVIGLSRLEWMPVLYRQFGELYGDKEIKSKLSESVALGARLIDPDTMKQHTDEKIKSEIQGYEKLIKNRETEIERINKESLLKYNFQKYLFLFALIVLMLSRFLTKIN